MSRCDQYEFGDDELYEHYVTQVHSYLPKIKIFTKGMFRLCSYLPHFNMFPLELRFPQENLSGGFRNN